MLYRPSPQIPRPSLRAAVLCFDACRYNIYMTRKQIETKSIDLTWIFTQSIFMVVNVMLWSLSYSEVRQNHSREEVEEHLRVALESIELASERWPGVASALELYHNLIGACMRIFDKDGDIPIAAGSPSDTASVVSNNVEGINRSRTTSPASVSTASVRTPSETIQPPFGYLPTNQNQLFNFNGSHTAVSQSPSNPPASLQASPQQQMRPSSFAEHHPKTSLDTNIPAFNYSAPTQFSSLPTTYAELTQWTPTFSMPQQEPFGMSVTQSMASPIYNETYAAHQGYPMTDYLYPQWSQESFGRGLGLNQEQQVQLMQDFEANETSKIEQMIQQSHQLFRPYSQASY